MTQGTPLFKQDEKTTGWQARLSLLLQPVSGKTRVALQQHIGPLRIQRAFYPEGDVCHLYLLHPPGGVVGGDSLSTHVELQPVAKALLTMPGATKFYRSKGETACVEQSLQLQENSELEWLPPGSIFFPGCRTQLKNEFHLKTGSRLIAWETFCFGRPVMGEAFDHGSVRAILRVWCDGILKLNEVLRVEDELSVLAGYHFHSTVLITPACATLLDAVREILGNRVHPAGATMLDDLMIIRLLDRDNLQLEDDLHQIWRLARPFVMGRSAVSPRIWST